MEEKASSMKKHREFAAKDKEGRKGQKEKVESKIKSRRQPKVNRKVKIWRRLWSDCSKMKSKSDVNDSYGNRV